MRHATFVSVRNASISSLIALFSVACVGQVADAPLPRTQLDPNASASAVELGQAFNRVAEALRPTVVFIRNESRQGRVRAARTGGATPSATSTGTGFIVREDGYVVTNYHVVEGAQQLLVRLYDEREYVAELVGTDPLTDLAVLKISIDERPFEIRLNASGTRQRHQPQLQSTRLCIGTAAAPEASSN
jgi:S1-C subfamily serine protease